MNLTIIDIHQTLKALGINQYKKCDTTKVFKSDCTNNDVVVFKVTMMNYYEVEVQVHEADLVFADTEQLMWDALEEFNQVPSTEAFTDFVEMARCHYGEHQFEEQMYFAMQTCGADFMDFAHEHYANK